MRHRASKNLLTQSLLCTASLQAMLSVEVADVGRDSLFYLDKTGLLKQIRMYSCNELYSKHKRTEYRKELHLC